MKSRVEVTRKHNPGGVEPFGDIVPGGLPVSRLPPPGPRIWRCAKAGLLRKVQPTNFFATVQALWPPKPKELLMMASTFISRAVWGT